MDTKEELIQQILKAEAIKKELQARAFTKDLLVFNKGVQYCVVGNLINRDE